MRNSVIDKIYSRAKRDPKVFLITGDAGFGVLDRFRDDFPDRFLNMGVAEQNMISFTSGMALQGHRVFVYNIVPFVLYRCYEQVRNDICYQELPVTLIGIGSGVTYSPQGVTHYSLEDIALARTMPNMTILSPADPQEAAKCAEYSFRSKSPVYIRIAKSGEPAIHKKGAVKDITKPITVSGGKGVAVLFHGSVSIEVLKSVEGLSEKPLVLSVPMLHPLDFGALKRRLKSIHTVITVEEHYREGGLGSILAENMATHGAPFKLVRLGIENSFVHEIRNNAGMREHFGFNANAIRKEIKRAYRNK